MTLFRRTLLAALILPALVPIAAGAAADIDAPAPAFKAVTADGKTVSLADFKGKTVVLEWTNHECPYVGKHYRGNSMQAPLTQSTSRSVVRSQPSIS